METEIVDVLMDIHSTLKTIGGIIVTFVILYVWKVVL